MRLWWHCRHCPFRFDTFGRSHDDPDDRLNAGYEAIQHLWADHGMWSIDRYTDAADHLRAGRATIRVVKHHILVER